MPLARHLTAAVAVLIAAAGSFAAQAAAQSIAAVDSQRPAATAPSAEQTTAPQPGAAQPLSLAPLEQNARVGVHALTPSGPAPIAPPRRDHVGSNVALMIVGGVVLIIGAVVGGTPGTLIMIGGGVVGVIGLYRYLQ
ncbi:MAG TPA: hypothetical protein VF368_05120 [Gemmatimonadaceae bacterium]